MLALRGRTHRTCDRLYSCRWNNADDFWNAAYPQGLVAKFSDVRLWHLADIGAHQSAFGGKADIAIQYQDARFSAE